MSLKTTTCRQEQRSEMNFGGRRGHDMVMELQSIEGVRCFRFSLRLRVSVVGVSG
jgi:hypothetical protein